MNDEQTAGTVSSEYRLTKWVVLGGMVLVAAGGVLAAAGSGGVATAGQIMLAVGGAVTAWSTGKYAESRGTAKSGGF